MQGTLKGSRLDEVARLTVKNITFVPGELISRGGSDELPMVAQDAQAAAGLKVEHSVAAKVALRDGRSLPVNAAIEASRPRVSLIGKSMQPSPSDNASNIQLTDAGEMPQDAFLAFSIRAQSPATFAHDETLDVATGDESSATTLSLANGGLTLENAQVAVATLNPTKAFGPSTFGPLKFRVELKGVTSDWQPLTSLVRLPALKELKCPTTPELACQLIGSNLFLIDSVAGDPEFSHSVSVPDGFLGYAIPVPHPAAGPLYIKLRDNPHVVSPTLLTVQQLPAPADDAGRTEARHSALPSDNAAVGDKSAASDKPITSDKPSAPVSDPATGAHQGP
jgi:hypothetical protein